MTNTNEELAIDGQLLGDAIIELNTSLRNVQIYPHDHPSVERSLDRVVIPLNRLFELRPEIKIGIAKDTLIIDEYYLDKKNPVYREFAERLSSLGISFITFFDGLTKDEIYRFHSFLVDASDLDTEEKISTCLKHQSLKHIKLNFVDYGVFTFDVGATGDANNKEHVWESYVYALLKGKSLGKDQLNEISRIEPENLAGLLNTGNVEGLNEESYNRVIATYLRTSSEGSFSGERLKRLTDFIMQLNPDIKKQFLSEAMKGFSRDTVSFQQALGDVSVDTAINLLQVVSEQRIALPEALRNLLEAFSKIEKHVEMTQQHFGDSCMVDDILLSPDVTNFLKEGDFRAFVTEKYEKEIQKVLQFDLSKRNWQKTGDLFEACESRAFEEHFSYILLELVTAGVLGDQEIVEHVPILREQGRHFVKTGQYAEALHVIKGLKDFVRETFAHIQVTVFEHFHAPEFVSDIIASFRALGRLKREEATALCDYYGEGMVPSLIDALIEEESAATRRFLILLITRFGKHAASEAVRRLEDDRWYVKRNMLTILAACGGKEVIQYVKTCCNDDNPKVVFEAVKCLLEKGDRFGVEIVMQQLGSHSKEHVNQAISLVGTYRIKAAVPVLIEMLRKKEITKTDYLDKIRVVEVLGELGDPKSIEALRNLASLKSILFKSAVEKLKEEVFKTLKHYPIEDVRDIAEGGTRSKNSIIRSESLQLVKHANQENIEQRQGHGII